VLANSKRPHLLGRWLISAAYADTPSLTADNFAVVEVDLSGRVLERVTLKPSDISKNADGTWSIQVPGYPRLDRLIVPILPNLLRFLLPVTLTKMV
jgi:hypothetical protein